MDNEQKPTPPSKDPASPAARRPRRTLMAGALAVVVNTGDDFEHLGLAISPDVDTTLYTLAGIADETRGWGRAGRWPSSWRRIP